MIPEAIPKLLRPRPITQVCCGCPVVVGVYFLLVVNLVVNVLFVVATVAHVIYNDQAWSVFFGDSMTTTTWTGGFMLGGIPFILVGLWGTCIRSEVMVRLYMYYFVVLSCVCFVWSVVEFLIPMTCRNLPDTSAKAHLCGMTRIVNLGTFFFFTVILAYFLAVVLSYANYLAFESNDLSEIRTKKVMWKFTHPWLEKVHKEQVDSHIDKFSSAYYSTAYGGFEGIGGSSRIFNGTYHETTYPLGAV
uniref:Uncharacterized protein n=1 Tax=Alexandrium catenella TaxID=2925 RepID=A0A7S1LPF4_ALECA|mmetsp:Transcript_117550/g.312706  ORF Transcript_117550/g.312706 Transcript_117550/m.312706 type:complete len:246 (+) Transcript_117550:60-797(+)